LSAIEIDQEWHTIHDPEICTAKSGARAATLETRKDQKRKRLKAKYKGGWVESNNERVLRLALSGCLAV